MIDFEPTPGFIAIKFEGRVREEVFADAQPPRGRRPLLVLLGGQPAAGKSKAQRNIEARSPSANLVAVTGDEFRKYHPQFEELTLHDPLRMPNVTSAVSGPLVRACLDYAKQRRYSVLLEGTFSDQAMVLGTAEEFGRAGYDVEVCAMAVAEDVSRLSAEERYLSEALTEPALARWTPPAAHDVSVTASPGVVAALEASPYVHRIEVWSRTEQIYANERGSSGAWSHEPNGAQAMLNERARAIGQPAQWFHLYDINASRAEQHRVQHGAGTEPDPYLADDQTFGVWDRLTTAAAGIVPAVVAQGSDQQAELTERVQEHAEQIRAAHGTELHVITARTDELPETTTKRVAELRATREVISARIDEVRTRRAARSAARPSREIAEIRRRPHQPEPSREITRGW